MTGQHETDDTGDDSPAEAARADRIGVGLRKVFDRAASEPIPEAFEELLRRLG